ncbi:MAG: Stk1 family PASTA domain-containing Ser/Thr kinase [Eubacterium sp.]|nr:Stk1 family PASTA domain-containing Ser/Thr kinase [Eubacterium sp.]
MIVNIGSIIGNRYEILEKVGTGGMADVYRAKDNRLNRFVALKVLKTEYSEDTKFVSKFRQEAQAVAAITHPNIVSVYDVGEEEGMHYIVMEFVDGITLKRYIDQKGKLKVKEAVGIALQIAAGLDAAHAHNIIHRDIKPQNILISRDGTAKVSDFGIAKAASSNTITANAMGSVHYISPEQARGGFSDEKSDIYSLGVTLYEMLSGTIPFTGESAVAVALAHIQEDATPLAAIDATIPRGLSNIVAKCMQKKTELRYASAADLIADLKMFLQDPSGDYGVVKPIYADSETIFISNSDVNTIRSATPHPNVEIPPQQPVEEEEEEGEVDPKLEKALIIGSIAVAVIIFIILIFLLGRFIGLWGTSSPTEETPTPAPEATATVDPSAVPEGSIVVPDVFNESLEDAQKLLEENKLTFRMEEQDSDEVQAGYAIGTNPVAGSAVEEGTEVILYISKGGSKNGLINVVGETVDQATTDLKLAGYQVQVGEEIFSDSVEKGRVASQDPKAGEEVAAGSMITLHVSKGKEEKNVQVPRLLGLSRAEAKQALAEAGLQLGDTTKSYSDSYDEGEVCVQSPAAGKEVKEGTTVSITVSKGPEPSYTYTGSVTVDNPFDYDTDPPARFKFVLKQDGNTTPLETITLSYTDFPYTISNITGYSADQGEVIVYKDGEQVAAYPVTFRRVQA